MAFCGGRLGLQKIYLGEFIATCRFTRPGRCGLPPPYPAAFDVFLSLFAQDILDISNIGRGCVHLRPPLSFSWVRSRPPIHARTYILSPVPSHGSRGRTGDGTDQPPPASLFFSQMVPAYGVSRILDSKSVTADGLSGPVLGRYTRHIVAVGRL